jgi:hypothetical protein
MVEGEGERTLERNPNFSLLGTKSELYQEWEI